MDTNYISNEKELLKLALAFDKFLNSAKWKYMMKSALLLHTGKKRVKKNTNRLKDICRKCGKIKEKRRREQMKMMYTWKRCFKCHRLVKIRKKSTKNGSGVRNTMKSGKLNKKYYKRVNENSERNLYKWKQDNRGYSLGEIICDYYKWNGGLPGKKRNKKRMKSDMNMRGKNSNKRNLKKNIKNARIHNKIQSRSSVKSRQSLKRSDNKAVKLKNKQKQFNDITTNQRENDLITQIPPTTPRITPKKGAWIKKREKFNKKVAMKRVNRRCIYKPKRKRNQVVIGSNAYLIEPLAKKRNRKLLNKSVEHIFKSSKKKSI